ncbi:MAG: NUDIX hydrolase [Oculatellaceae cyanobacterium bins.114]|nr:NUDIX hydrolase [Oculatellaceae cyanobacterium bins.114]
MLRQSGVIPYRFHNEQIEVLLVTSSRSQQWTIPKGWIEVGMSADQSAAKEAWEEAGVVGRVTVPAIGSYKVRKLGVTCVVQVFLMLVQTEQVDYPEAKQRQRQWVSVAEAIHQVHRGKLKQLLKQVQRQEQDLGIF